MQQRKENTAAKHPDNNLEDNDICSSATSHASEQGWLTGMRRRKRQRRRGFSFLKAKCRAADRVHRQAHTPHLSSPLATFPLLLASRLTFFVVLLAEVADRQAAGCLEDVSGGEGSVGPPSFFFARFRGELRGGGGGRRIAMV